MKFAQIKSIKYDTDPYSKHIKLTVVLFDVELHQDEKFIGVIEDDALKSGIRNENRELELAAIGQITNNEFEIIEE